MYRVHKSFNYCNKLDNVFYVWVAIKEFELNTMSKNII